MIKVTPVGGLGEIGSNMVCWSDQDHGFIVDCGILFPYEEIFEINYLIPNFEKLDSSLFKHLIVTHSHEDHIGAITHLVKWNPQIIIYASEFAAIMIRKRLEENKLTAKFKDINDEIKIGSWKINALDINHSTPETKCLVIGHQKKSISFCYASDFKINMKNVDGPAFKPSRVKKLMSNYSLRIGMLDSTNILNEDKTPDEGSLTLDLEEVIAPRGRCFITLFASNICRLNNIVKIGKKYKKTICVIGRSVWNAINVAQEAMVADFVKEDFVSVENIGNVDDENLLFIVSGCQGDFKSALRRISYGEDPVIKLYSGDKFVFSSKTIPGNEDKLSRIYNKLSAKGVEIVTAYDKKIHCSGHAGQKDLSLFIEGNNFTHYIPIHGETYFLHKHRKFVQKKYPDIEVVLLNNAEELVISKPNREYNIEVKTNMNWGEPKLILENMVEIERSQISQRRKVAQSGAVFLSIGTKRNDWHCTFFGLPLILEEKKDKILDNAFYFYVKEGKNKSISEIREQVRIKVRNFIKSEIGIKPVCIVH